ncbi:MAG: hypothetical protein JWR32_1441 [Mycobacterium sp.]|jgi:hypothetical protein|nr:hypothetical protein [Mycobacterium sp.]
MGAGHGIQHATGGGPDQLALRTGCIDGRTANEAVGCETSQPEVDRSVRAFTSLQFIRPGALL